MKTFFIQPLAVISIFFVGYVLVNYTFYQKVSEEWIDALWAFPIFFVHGCIAIYVYFQLNEYQNEEFSTQNQEIQETSFAGFSILLPLFLIFQPLFLFLYYGIYDDFLKIHLKPFQIQSYKILNSTSYQYGNENYTELYLKYCLNETNCQQEIICLSNNYQSSVFNINPPPYKSINKKLPSWLCNSEKSYEQWLKYSQKVIYKDQKVISFEGKIHFNGFVFLIFTIYQLGWLFSLSLVFLVVIYYNTIKKRSQEDVQVTSIEVDKNNSQTILESQQNQDQQKISILIQYPSRKKRAKLMLLSYFQYISLLMWLLHADNVFQQNILLALILVPSILFFVASLFSKFHWNILKSLIQIKVIGIIFIILYFILFLASSIIIYSFQLFLSRHFVSLWYRIEESQMNPKIYNQFINRILLLNWIINIFMVLIILGIFNYIHPNLWTFPCALITILYILKIKTKIRTMSELLY